LSVRVPILIALDKRGPSTRQPPPNPASDFTSTKRFVRNAGLVNANRWRMTGPPPRQ
jgi:hypothetical protein